MQENSVRTELLPNMQKKSGILNLLKLKIILLKIILKNNFDLSNIIAGYKKNLITILK